MTRCGCAKESVQQSQYSPSKVGDEEPLVLVTEVEAADLSFKVFSNSKLKAGTFSVCRGSHCTFNEMYHAVVGSEGAAAYKGYLWAIAHEIRAIFAKRNTMRDKTPGSTPKKVGAFCVIDDGEPKYSAHACLAFSNPVEGFWALHDTLAARGDLLIAFQTRGVFSIAEVPPFKGA